eukprot:1157108-Pelagomonas_calceolata.AAC.5
MGKKSCCKGQRHRQAQQGIYGQEDFCNSQGAEGIQMQKRGLEGSLRDTPELWLKEDANCWTWHA